MKQNARRVFLLLSLALLLSDALLLALYHHSSSRALHHSFEERGGKQQAAFQLAYEATLTSMVEMATFISLDPAVRELFLQAKQAVEREGGGAGGRHAERIRQALLSVMEPRWQHLTEAFDVRQLHFHLGPGSLSFLRVHRPEKFGDRMDDLRHIIVDSYDRRETLSGFETGRVYSGLRGVVPMFAHDPAGGGERHVGTLEVGTSFATLFDTIDRQLASGVAALLRSSHVDSTMWEEAVDRQFQTLDVECDCFVEAASRPVATMLRAMIGDDGGDLTERKTHWLKVDGKNYALTRFPLYDYLAQRDGVDAPVGAIVIWSDADTEVAAYHQDLQRGVLMAVAGFLLLELLLYYSVRKVTARLEGEVHRQADQLLDAHRRLEGETRQREDAQQRLESHGHLWQSVVDAVTTPVLAVGLDYRIQLLNRAARNLAEENGGEPTYCYQVAHGRDAPCDDSLHACPLKEILESGKPTSVFLQREGADDQVRHVEIDAWPNYDRDGKLCGIIEVERDVTEQKRVERMLTEAKETADHANQAKSDFLANMSHELRTPMHAILSFAALGEEKLGRASEEKVRNYFSRVRESGERLLRLLNDLLDLSKLEAGRMQFQWREVDITTLIDEVVSELAPLANDREVRFERHIETENGVARCDDERIRQVIRNLAFNAVKFSPTDGRVRLTISDHTVELMGGADLGGVAVSVSDQGPGIPADELEHIFDKFAQSSHTNSGTGGTGLGLAISREIIHHHGGEIWAENNDEGGAMVTFVLLRYPQPLEVILS